MSDEEMRAKLSAAAWKAWEEENKGHRKGINPDAFTLGFTACAVRLGVNEIPEKYTVKIFTNQDRNRYYGKRIGDVVKSSHYKFGDTGLAVVSLFGHMDNNRILVTPVGTDVIMAVVAEWCDVVVKVEEITRNL